MDDETIAFVKEKIDTLRISKGEERRSIITEIIPNGKDDQIFIMRPELGVIDAISPLFIDTIESDIDKESLLFAIQILWSGVLRETIDYMIIY